MKGCRWSEAKNGIEAKEGRKIDDKRFTELLNNLVKASFLVKEEEDQTCRRYVKCSLYFVIRFPSPKNSVDFIIINLA
ncbi:hypothetical protein [Sulfurisphaera ohwakuensis]|uniref:hypothetical protein n=1 Tax=Sulfurisphaera ohwakuensis TaxID=69656 RepID=UPI0036F36210